MKSEIDSVFLSDNNRNANNNDGINSKVISEDQVLSNESPENDIQPPFDYCVIDHSGERFSCINLGNCHEQPNCFKFGLLQENLDFRQLQYHSPKINYYLF